MSSDNMKRPPRWMTVGLPIVLLAFGAAMAVLFLSTRPSAGRGAKSVAAPLLVQTVDVAPQTQAMIVEVMGTVVASREIDLNARVSGQVASLAPGFVPGGLLKAGETALTLDDADYALAARQAENALATAQADLDLEMGQQRVAQAQLQMLSKDDPEAGGEEAGLALRQPQLAQARAAVDDAAADLEQARLNLARTRVAAPFNALVTARSVAEGSEVTTSLSLGTLVGVDEYWVEAAVPVDQLRHIAFNAKGGHGSPVEVIGRSSATPHAGYVLRNVGELVESSRMARVLISVPDPLGLKTGGQPLVLNEYVTAKITGPSVEGVYILPRSALREGGSVWVAKGSTLDIRPVTVGWSDADKVYITAGLEPGLKVVTSSIASPVQGMNLRLDDAQHAPAKGSEAANEG